MSYNRLQLGRKCHLHIFIIFHNLYIFTSCLHEKYFTIRVRLKLFQSKFKSKNCGLSLKF